MADYEAGQRKDIMPVKKTRSPNFNGVVGILTGSWQNSRFLRMLSVGTAKYRQRNIFWSNRYNLNTLNVLQLLKIALTIHSKIHAH